MSHWFMPCYRKAMIFAFAVLVSISGNFALAQGSENVQPAQEDSKNSDQATDKKAEEAPQSNDSKPEATAAATPTPAAPAPAAGPPILHRLSLRLSGSMCYACLKDLQDNLLKYSGIEKVRVDKPTQNFFQGVSPDVSSWAQGIIIYDEKQIPLEYVRMAIKKHGYHSYRVVDKVLDHKPEEKDLKF
jgi:copper chaperone CopZ